MFVENAGRGGEKSEGQSETTGLLKPPGAGESIRRTPSSEAVQKVQPVIMFCCCFIFIQFLVISVRPVISTSTGPSFTKFAGLVEVWANDLKLCFSISYGTLSWQPILRAKSTSNPHLVVRVTFARAAPPAYDKKGYCNAGRKQTNYLIRWTQANQLTD